MKIEKSNIVYFLGIGGIGMSALARWFNANGKQVFGYDKAQTDLTNQLQLEGMEITFHDNRLQVPSTILNNKDECLVIYTPAIPSDSDLLCFFRENNYKLMKRSEALGNLTANSFTLAVAGTHGKTTTSSILAHILFSAGKNLVSFVGGLSQNYGTNLIVNEGKGKLNMVVEADEYDRSFLQLQPDIAIITALDPDHLDIYGTEEEMFKGYQEFIRRIKVNGSLIIKKGLAEHIFPADRPDIQMIEYSMDHNPIRTGNLRMEGEEIRFDYINPEVVIKNIAFTLPGFHNIENAVAAITAAKLINIDDDVIKYALSNFRGIKRRFEYVIYSKEVVFIDDYAHHPTELRALLSSVKAIFPRKKLTVIFQPHLYSRTRDFAVEFSRSLDLANEVILLDIYPAREKPIPGVSSTLLLDAITLESKQICEKQQVINELDKRSVEVLLTVGAGDIDHLVKPISQYLKNRYELDKI